MPNHDSIHLAKHAHRSLRRRIHAVLRMAHRVMGMRGKRLGIGALASGGRVSCVLGGTAMAAILLSLWSGGAALANTINTSPSCVTGSNSVVGRTNPGGTTNQATDGTGTYSTVAGCESSASGVTAGSVYGSFAKATGEGGSAFGVMSLGGKWGTGIGLEAQATATAATAVGFGTRATGNNSVAIGGAGGNGTNALSVANSTTASGQSSIAIGANDVRGAQAAGANSIAFGGQSTVTAASASGIAIGRGANVAASYGMAQGDGALANGLNAIAIGTSSSASGGAGSSGSTAIAIGTGSNAVAGSAGSAIAFGGGAFAKSNTNAGDTLAFGASAQSTGQDSVAIGAQSIANNVDAIAIGGQGSLGGTTTSSGVGAVSIGLGAQATANAAYAMGYGVRATGENAIAVGRSSNALAQNAMAYGVSSNASGVDAVAMGSNSLATSTNAIAFGISSKANGTNAVAFGGGSVANAANAIAFGQSANAAQANAIAFGISATANGDSAIAFGLAANANAANATAIGTNSKAAGANGVAVGLNSISGATGQNVAIGVGANANAATAAGGAVAIGLGQKAIGDGAVAIGDPNVANGAGAVALGANNTAAGNTTGTTAANGAVALGNANFAVGQGSVSLGNQSNAAAAGALAFGDKATGAAANAVALGSGSNAGNANDVALGAGSTTAAVVNTPSGTINGTSYNYAGNAANSTVSVGSSGKERTITNVAAGRISGTSTDAVNGSQLFATNQAVNAIGTSVTTIGNNVNNLGNSAASTLGGGTTYNPATGTLSGFSQTINPVSNTGAVGAAAAQTTVAGALNQLNTNTSNLANIAVKYDAPGGSKITLGATGGAGAPAGGVTITNLANGAVTAASTDVVNGSQLFAVQQTANKGWNANTAAVAGSTGTVSGSALTNIAPGGTVTYQAGNNIAITQTGNAIAIATSMTPTFTSVTAGNSKLDTTGLTITGGPSVTTAGINAASKAITNVAAGTNATDAVNLSQLNTVATSVTNLGNNVNNLGNSAASTIGGGTTFNTATGTLSGFSQGIKAVDAKGNAAAATTNYTTVAGALTQLDTNTTNLANAAVKYDDPAVKNKITLGNAGTPVTITNVANGALTTTSTDAVNGSQLLAVQQTANKGWNLSTNKGATTSNIAPGGTVDLNNSDGNVVITQSGPNATFNLASNLAIASSVTVGNSKLDTTGLTIAGGPSVTTAGINAAGKAITSVAAGTNATDAVNLSQLNTVATSVTNLGNNVNNLGNSTASNLGGGSTYNPATGTVSAPSYNIGGTTYNNVGNAFNAVNTSVTALQTDALQWNKTLGAYDASHGSGSPQKITNVANGAVTAASTDAVTGQQLFDVQQTASKGWNANTGTVAGSTGTASGSASTKIAPGDTVTYQAGNNIAITQTGNTIAIATSMTPTFTSVTAGNSKLDTTGLTITGGPSVTTAGINAASKAITNVAAGTNATDAVNLSQLNTVSTSVTNLGNNVNNLGNSTASTIGGGTTFNTATGTLSGFSQGIKAVDAKGNAAAATTNYTTVAGALTQLDTNTTNLANAAVKYDDPAVKDRITLGNAGTPVTIGNVANGVAATDAVNVSQLDAVSQTANKGWNLSTNKGASTSNIAPGGTVDLSNTDGNVVIGQSGPNATFDLASNVKIANSLSVGAVTIDTTSVVVGASKLDATGLTITGGPSVTTAGVDAGGKKITNVANGDVTATSTDAVNGSQLFAVVGNATANAVQYDDATKTKITLGGAGATQPTQITNLANGAVAAGSTDAVNGSQLYDVQQTANKGWNLTANGANSSNVAPGSTVDLNNTDGNLAITKTGNAVTFNLSKDVTVDSVTAGNSKLDTSGLTIAGGPSVTTAGIDAGNKAITNVAAGTNATDAVNLSQLNSVSTSVTNLGNNVNNLGNSTASTIGGGTTYDPNTGTLSGFSQTVTAVDDKGNAGTASKYDTVGGALTQLDTNTTNLANAAVKYDDPAVKDRITLGNAGTPVTIGNVANGVAANDAVNVSQLQAVGNNANAGWNLSTGGDTAGKSNVGPGGTVDLSNTDGNIVIAHNGPNATFDLAKSITLDSVTAGGNTLDATGLTVGNTTVTTDGLTITGGPSVTTAGIDAGNKKVTNLADGSDPNDAVNFSQLNTVATSVTNLGNNVNNLGSTTASTLGGGASYDPATGKIANFSQNVTAVDGKGNVGASTAYTTVAGALTQLDTNTTNLANAAVKYDDPATKDKITLGNAGTPVTIGNVANGVAANDAVNVSQLQAVGNNANAGWNLSTGGDTAGKSNVGPGGTVDLSNTDGNIVIAHNGPNATFDLAKSITLDSVTAGGNTLDATGLTVGNTTVTTNGLTITGGPSVTATGIDAGSKAITNVAAGTNATDAVNVGQLQTVSNAAGNLGNSTASTLGGGTTYDPATGTLSGFSQTVTAIDGKGNVGTTTGYTTVAGALTQLDTNTTNLANAAVKYDDPAVKDKITLGNAGTPVTIGNVANGVAANDAVNVSQLQAVGNNANAGWNLSTGGDTTNKSNVGPGGTVDLSNTDGNIVIAHSGPNATFDLAKSITLDSVTAGGNTLDASGLTVGNTTVTTNGLIITGGPSVTIAGIDAGGKKITNVANGDVTATSTDAVNGSQIFSLGNSMASGLGGGSSFDPSSGTVITSLNYGGSTFTSVQSVLDKIGGSINGGGIKYFHTNSTGPDSVASGQDSIGIGPSSVASGGGSIAMGNGAQSSGKNAIATGTQANASADNAIATGNAAEASGTSSVAMGNGAQSSGNNSIATGTGAEAIGNNSMASGTGAKASADGAIASGNGAEASGTDSIATGTGSKATQTNSVAMGAGADTSSGQAGDVALGAGSKTSTVVQTSSGTVNGTTYNYAGGAPTSTVSVGSVGNERTVTNVAAGQVTATSTDAVNGSQLYATNQEIGKVGQQVANLAENAVQYDAGTDKGSITLGGANGTTITNVANGAVSATSSDAVNGSQLYDVQQQANKGWNLSTAGETSKASNVAPGATVDFSSADGNMVISKTVTQTGDVNVQYALANDVKVANSISVGGTGGPTIDKSGMVIGQTQLTSDGLSFAGGGPKVSASGIDGGGKAITGVAQGTLSTTSTDAVNGSQLYATNQNVQNLANQINNFGGSIANLQSQVSNNLKEARQGISQAMAASALRYDDRPGKVSAAAGMAVYHRQVGLAAGLGWTSEDAKWRANIAGTYSAGGRKPDFGVMGGLSYTFN
ncbi:hypothetical protein [Labrys neptuniae]|uniref:Calcium-binding protein n=1 Tax=Labrys neptuniae TaxID=376174 RepID=A0ABV3PRG3_9HYPH